MKKIILAFIFISVYSYSFSQDLSVISWNLESGGSSIKKITQLLNDGKNSEYKNIGIWGFSEVKDINWAFAIKDQLIEDTGNDHWFEIGNTGGADKLMIVFDKTKFEMLDKYELTEINIGGRVRAPLVIKLKDVNNGIEFIFMVNHLYRSNNEARNKQSELLVEWVKEQDIPVIAVGDYNFDYSLKPNKPKGNTSFFTFTQNNHWVWVEPSIKVMTQCNTYYNSILDFIFLNDDAASWNASSEIIVVDNDCPSDHTTPDHRPIKAEITY